MSPEGFGELVRINLNYIRIPKWIFEP